MIIRYLITVFLVLTLLTDLAFSDSRKVSFNFQKIPLSQALKVYADFTKQNLVIDSKLTEIIDMRLSDLTSEQVLDVLVDMYDLHVIQKQNVLIVMRKFDFDNRNTSQKVAVIPLRFLSALDVLNTLQSGSNQSSSPSSGSPNYVSAVSFHNTISANPQTNSILLQGTSAFIDRNKKIIAVLDVPQQQIKITAKLVIVSLSDLQKLGLKLKTYAGNDDMSKLSSLIDLGVAASSSFSFFISKAGKFLLDLELDLLKQNGLVEILSSPSVFTLTNKTASISQGVQIPFQVQDQNQSFHTEFKDAALSMAITPRYSGQSILLDVSISKDSVGDVLNDKVSIEKRQIVTSVDLRDGDTVVLGGIVENVKTDNLDRVPFLSDIPYVGEFFKRVSNSVSEKRLVVFITPELVNFPPSLPVHLRKEEGAEADLGRLAPSLDVPVTRLK